jgi:hypothetical protein
MKIRVTIAISEQYSVNPTCHVNPVYPEFRHGIPFFCNLGPEKCWTLGFQAATTSCSEERLTRSVVGRQKNAATDSRKQPMPSSTFPDPIVRNSEKVCQFIGLPVFHVQRIMFAALMKD